MVMCTQLVYEINRFIPCHQLTHTQKQQNIVINDKGDALLIDFGLARIKHEVPRSNTTSIQGGMYRYLAPELYSAMIEGDHFRTSYASDSYALGMTIYELVMLQHPYSEHRTSEGAARQALKRHRPARPDNVENFPPHALDALWDLLGDMWAHDDKKRPSLDISESKLLGVSSLLATDSGDKRPTGLLASLLTRIRTWAPRF